MNKKKKRGWVLGILSGLVTAGVLAGGFQGKTGYAQSGFLSDVFQYGKLPDSQSIKSTPVTLTGNEWKGTDGNMDITSVGTTEVNSSSISYGDKETAFYGARDFAREKSANYQLLSGENSKWDLTVVSNMEAAEKLGKFWQGDYTEQKTDGWKSVELPASWTSYGFDYPIYTNSKMPFQENVEFPQVPVKNNPVGLYRKNFQLKDSISQSNGRIYITFGGVESAYYVYINGKEVGYSEDSYNPHAFDITDYLNPQGQENLLAVKVIKFCDGTWMEDQDMIYDGGIFRDVYLTEKPNVHISDYRQITELADDYQSGDLKLNISTENVATEASENMGVEITLYQEDGSVVLTDNVDVDCVASGDTKQVEKIIHVENPELWDADHPNLYTMVLSLYGKTSGIHYESVSQNVGFRELSFTSTQVSSDGTYSNVTNYYETVKLNGKRLIIKGVNRHDSDPETGKYISHKVYETDVKLMKKNNINAIRTSHYANDDYLYYLCDKYGMYLMCETNNESHAIRNQEEKLVQLEKACMNRQGTAYARLKNVTANLMWSIGNESSGTDNGAFANGMFSKMVQFFKEKDSTRMVHYEGLCANDTNTAGGVDMNSHMYYDPDAVKRGAENATHMPYILCEYDHAMGNAVGNLKEYWDIIRTHDNLLGGFIWDWVDQSRKIPLSNKAEWDYYSTSDSHQSGLNQLAGYYLGYGGDWGDTNNDSNFCQNGLVSADRDVQPELKEVKYQYQDFWMTIGEKELSGKEIKISNESLSKKLSEYEFTWQLKEDDTVLSEGTVEEELLPKEEKNITIPYEMPEKKKAGAEYFLNLSIKTKEASGLLDKGDEVSYAQFKIGAEVEKGSRMIDANGVKVTRGDKRYTFQGKDFSFVINTTEGVIENYTYQGKVLMKKGPKPNFNRATLDNDYIRYKTIANAMETMKVVKTPAITQDQYGRFVVTIQWNGTDKRYDEPFNVVETMAVDGDGTVDVAFQYDFSKVTRVDLLLRKVGTILTLSEGQENITWYGNGDVESYSDRQSFARVGKYQATVSEMFYPFPKPQDCGNLTEVRWMQVCDDVGDGMLFAAQDCVNASALHFTPEQLGSVSHVKDLKESKETYVTLDCAVAGTGNNSCGYRTLEKYRLQQSQYTCNYVMKPIQKDSDAMTLSKNYQKDVKIQAQQYTKIPIMDEKKPDVPKDTQPTKVIGPVKGKTFTAGNFKYKVTVASTMTGTKVTAGKVTVVGLSKTGKKKSSVNVKNTVKQGSASYQVTALGNKAFKKAAKLKKVTLGTKMKAIPTSAFEGCKKLATVSAKGVTKIGKSAFKNCKKLNKLTLGKKISSVKKGAFKGCKKTIKVTGGSKKANIKKLKKSGYKKFK